jgi:hypothetical protein
MMRYSMSQNDGQWRTPNVGQTPRASAPAAEEGAATGRHYYNRHGTATTPFVAPNELNGTVISQCHPRHRHASMTCYKRARESTRE